MDAVSVSGVLSGEVNAGWPRIGGVAGQLGQKVSAEWKGSAGAAWNRGITEPWREKVVHPIFVDPYVAAFNQGKQRASQAREDLKERERRAIEEARKRWNEAFQVFEAQVRQYALNNAPQLGIRNLNDLDQFLNLKKQDWLRTNPFPQ